MRVNRYLNRTDEHWVRFVQTDQTKMMNEITVQVPGSGKQPAGVKPSGNQGASAAKGFSNLLQNELEAKQKSEKASPSDLRLLPEQISLAEIEKIYAQPKQQAAAAYAVNSPKAPQTSDWEVYKDEQLLSSPGGDGYDYAKQARRLDPGEQDGFFQSAAKDLKDAFANGKFFFQDLFFGSTRFYRDRQGQVQERQQQGFLSSLVECVQDIGSALSFGLFRPDGEKEPQGLDERLEFSVHKFKEAVWDDGVQGLSGSLVHLTEDLLLSGWNLVEAVPDSTIGRFESGRKLTTTIFDNGQVAIDYLTDVLPSGEAWLRVHSGKLDPPDTVELPVVYNLKTPEHFPGDARWRYIRNTPFRKSIETIGSLLADAVTFQVMSKARLFSRENTDGQ